MNFLVIGHSVEDHIVSDDHEIIKPGGIYYSVFALSSVISGDSIYLCTSAEKDNYYLFEDVFNLCKPDFIQFSGPIPKVLLTIHGEKEREERYKNINKSLEIPYDKLNDFDGILINMVTGFDIELEQLKKIRQNFSGIIYLDVHTLSRGMNHHGHRGFRQIENFKYWAECVDIIQVNEFEIKTLSDKTSDDEIANEILHSGTRQIILTKGALGAAVYYLQNGELNSIFQPVSKVNLGNKIGLGDVFGAVYFYNYIKTGDLFSSLQKSVFTSGLAAEQNGLIKLKKN